MMAWKPLKAMLHEHAFVSLVTAALEVFDKETMGLLIGSQHRHNIHIKSAIPYQNVSRRKDEVSIWHDHEIKVRHTLGDLTGYKVIGDFHSHPLWPNYLSDQDVKLMIEDGERITLLIVIEYFKKHVPWQYDEKDKALIGTIRDDFLIRMKVYIREYGSKKIRKLRIECPYTKKLNKHAAF